MGWFDRLKRPKLSIELCVTYPLGQSRLVHIPIWYVFKNGERRNLYDRSLIIEDFTGEYRRCRQIGYKKIERWEKLNKNSAEDKLPVPKIVFYEKLTIEGKY